MSVNLSFLRLTVWSQDILKTNGVLCGFLLWINTQCPSTLRELHCILLEVKQLFLKVRWKLLTGRCLVSPLWDLMDQFVRPTSHHSENSLIYLWRLGNFLLPVTSLAGGWQAISCINSNIFFFPYHHAIVLKTFKAVTRDPHLVYNPVIVIVNHTLKWHCINMTTTWQRAPPLGSGPTMITHILISEIIKCKEEQI